MKIHNIYHIVNDTKSINIHEITQHSTILLMTQKV